VATTANRAYPYPVAGDSPAGHTQIAALANAVDADMANVDRLQYKFVTTDVSLTSNTTLASITGLSATVAASTRYRVNATLFYTAATAGDLKIGWTAPAAATAIYGIQGLVSSATAITGTFSPGYSTTSGNLIVGGVDATNLFCTVELTLLTSVTAGTFQLQFAQGTSSVTATVIKASSTMTVLRVS
jgi:hypothetical protein